ncbi:BA75_03345T0 [Komagataella pastoris]|uniref:F-actin-capping protein subunit alpha n=1 Tax=Komagataella pastoris TaxID=4922 RepID=A0A1B2JF10_PICPA|nr:BA75_03345T0 [Komagataella pastoris]
MIKLEFNNIPNSSMSIISEFVQDIPPGEARPVIRDLKLVAAEFGTEIKNELETHVLNSDFHLVQDTSQGLLAIVSRYTQRGTKYIDYSSNLKFHYDFVDQKSMDTEEFSEDLLPEYNTVAKELEKYTQEHFPDSYKVVLAPFEEGFHVIIVDVRYNDKNFYNGKWQSFYTFNSVKGLISGQVRIKIHYYEDGNVTLNSHKKLHLTETKITDIVNHIRSFEDDYQRNLLSSFNNLNENVFKNLRRQLPINRSKVQWGKSIGTYKLGQDIGGGRE